MCYYALYKISFIIIIITSQEKDTIQGSPTDLQGPARPATWLLSSLIEERKLRPGLGTSGLSLRVPSTRLKTYGDRAFSAVAPRLWNSLPVILRRIDDLENFKADLKTYPFRQM